MHSYQSTISPTNISDVDIKSSYDTFHMFRYIFCTRPKSCFGGVNEQSGYLVFQGKRSEHTVAGRDTQSWLGAEIAAYCASGRSSS